LVVSLCGVLRKWPDSRPSLGTAFVPPGNEVEEIITRAWQETLGIDSLGVYDNFFDLGGNSLIGMKLIARLKKDLDVDIPIVALFEGPTVSALATVISYGRSTDSAYEDNRSRGEKRRERAKRRHRVTEPA
jgi:acyl carrier protein